MAMNPSANEKPRTYRIEQRPGGNAVAVCTCGWQSDSYPNPGIAGAAWDRHDTEEHGSPSSS